MSKSATSKVSQYAAVGRAADGVVILRPPVPPKHFTQSQIEKTVDSIRDATGRLIGRKRGSSDKTSTAR